MSSLTPVARDDTLTAIEDTPITYTEAQLVGNDVHSLFGGSFSIFSVTSIAGGIVVLNGDGTVTFTPTANFNGGASFSYVVTDSGAGHSNPATVTVNVAAVPDVTHAVDDTGDATEKSGVANNISGSDATGNVLANDVADTSLTVTAIRVGGTEGSGTAGTLGAALTGAHGKLTLGANGDYNYVVNDNDALVQALNDSGLKTTLTDVFNYSMSDGNVADTARLTITIHGANDGPVAVNDTGSATERSGVSNGTAGSSATGNVMGNDTDVDSRASLTVSAVRTGGTEGSGVDGMLGAALAGTYGTLTLAANGSYRYLVDEDNLKVQALNSTGPKTALNDVFNYTLSDGSLTDTAVLIITIHGADDAPVAVNDAGSAIEMSGVANSKAGKGAAGNVLTNDFDIDNPDAQFTVTAVHAGNAEGRGLAGVLGMALTGAHGMLTLNPDGSYSYVVDEDDARVQALNSTGPKTTLTDVFNYTMSDGSHTDTALLTVTIQGANDAPVAVNDSGSAVERSGVANRTAGKNAIGNLLNNDTDPDTIHSSLGVTAIRAGATEGSGVAGTLGNALAGAYGTLTLNADGSYSYVVNDNDAKVQALNSTGPKTALNDIFNYTMSDGSLTDTALLIVTIHGADDAAVAVNDTGSATEKGGVANGSGGRDATGNVLTNDSDVDNPGAQFTVTAVHPGAEGHLGPGTVGTGLTGAHGLLTLNTDGSYIYAVNENDVRVQALNSTGTNTSLTDVFNYTMSDGSHSDTATLTITIHGANDLAVLSSATKSLVEGISADDISANGRLTISDPDSPKTFVAQHDTAGHYGTFSIDETGAWSYTASSAHSEFVAGATYTDTFTAASADGAHSTVKINILGQDYSYSNLDSAVVANANNQNLWGKGLEDNRFLGVQGTIDDGLKKGDFHADISGSYKLGLQSDFDFNSGKINANVPIDAHVSSGYDHNTGVLHVDTSGLGALVDQGSFSTQSPTISYALDLYSFAQASLSLGISISHVISASKSFDVNFGSATPTTLLGFDQSGLTFLGQHTTGSQATIDTGTGISLMVQIPQAFNTTSHVDGDHLASQGSTTVMQLNVDVPELLITLAEEATGEEIPVNPLHPPDIDLNNDISVGYTILDYIMSGSFGLDQKYSLAFTGVKGDLIFEDGKDQVFNLGDSFDVANAMSHDANHDGTLTAQVVYTPRATLHETFGLIEDLSHQLLIGEAHADLHHAAHTAAKDAGVPTSYDTGYGYNSDHDSSFPDPLLQGEQPLVDQSHGLSFTPTTADGFLVWH